MLLRRRLLLLFIAVVVAVLGLGIVMVVTLVQRDDAQQHERQVSVAAERVAQLGAAYADQETGQRGYVITGLPTFLEPYVNGRARADRLVVQLHQALDTPSLQRRLRTLTAAIGTWQRDAAKPEIALTQTGGPAAASAAVAGGRGRTLFDEVRSESAALAGQVQVEVGHAEDHLDSLRRRLTALFVGILIVAVLGAMLAAWLIRRWVTRPIDRLADEVRRVRGGALDWPIRVDGPPELASLALDVDAMRGRIRQQLEESERSREAVEQSAAVVLTLRSELEPIVTDIPDGWSVAGRVRAAEGVVAGDCFDLFVTRTGELALVVVDIAGHGATEGILALRCKEMIRTALTSGAAPGDALGTTAEILGDMGDEVFLTAFVAVIDTGTGRITYANAGHPPAYVVTDTESIPLAATGPLVGLLAPGWATSEAVMGPGQNLCAYTDGILEARDDTGDFYGPDRLVELLRHTRCDQAGAVVQRTLDEVERFSPAGLRDDATIVVLCRAE